jgi:hypothetical protein
MPILLYILIRSIVHFAVGRCIRPASKAGPSYDIDPEHVRRERAQRAAASLVVTNAAGRPLRNPRN